MTNTDDSAVASTSTSHLVQQQILLTVGVNSSAFTAGSGKKLKRKDIDLIALPCLKERGFTLSVLPTLGHRFSLLRLCFFHLTIGMMFRSSCLHSKGFMD